MFDRSTWSESSGVSDAALPGAEGTFLPVSFWLVQALALTGRRKEAKELFETLLNYPSPLGLYGEEMARVSFSNLATSPTP
jgi:GH15 family glucan-1,4-alpha-glucosidase